MSSKTVRFLRRTLKLHLEELKHRNLTLHLVYFFHGAVLKYSHLIKFPLAILQRSDKNLLHGLLDVNELA